MNRKLIISSSSSSSVLLYYYEERCLGARSERLFLKRRENSRFSPFSFVFFFDQKSSQIFSSATKREKEKEEQKNVSPFDFSLVDRFDTNNNFNNNNNNNNNNKKKKKKKKKKTKEIDNKYTEYS